MVVYSSQQGRKETLHVGLVPADDAAPTGRGIARLGCLASRANVSPARHGSFRTTASRESALVGPALTIATLPPLSAQACTSLKAEKTWTDVPTTSSRSELAARALAASSSGDSDASAAASALAAVLGARRRWRERQRRGGGSAAAGGRL